MISCSYSLLHHFDLSIDDLAGEPIDRDVHPVTLLIFDDKAYKTSCVRRVATALRDHIDHQNPGVVGSPRRTAMFKKRA